MSVPKTYKLFIGGKFPRTESGRSYELRAKDGSLLANVSLASRKDLREAVAAARRALPAWSGATAFLRSQVLYRAAEMMDGRRAQFAAELAAQGSAPAAAEKETAAAIDLLVHYAGWCDKFQTLSSSVNPVASPHFNFSVPEPLGVAGALAPSRSGLLGLASLIAPALAGGNALVLLAPETLPLCALTLAEALQVSDLPGGTVNILTGSPAELLPHLAAHMDVDALVLCTSDRKLAAAAEKEAVHNLKRVRLHKDAPLPPGLQPVLDLQETKTTWHPVGL